MSRWNKSYSPVFAVLLMLWIVQSSLAQSSNTPKEEKYGTFGGPDSVQSRIESDRAEKDTLYDFGPSKSWYDWKDNLHEKYGYSFGIAYIPTFVMASDSLPGTDKYASGAVIRHFGRWELFGRGTDTTGTLNYLVEYRHRISDTTPSEFSIGNLGNVGFTEIPFAKDKWHLTNLYWAQSWLNGQYEMYTGYLDITDFVDVYPLTSPWTDYFNFVFSIGAATMDVPDDASLGLAAGAWLNDNTYIIGGFEDLNSDPTDPAEGFNTFFNDNEYFKHIEIGWTGASQEEYYLDNTHITLWHSDQRDKSGIADGWGAVLSITKTVKEKWLPFMRAGYSEDGGSILKRSISAGLGYQPNKRGDQFGIGANWGKPNDDLLGSGLNDQYAFEAYYRLQITKELAITPDIQLLIDPALNPDKGEIWVFGLRARYAF
jgi:porin